MAARLLDDLIVAVHYVVMAYIVFGGFLAWAWKWRWTFIVHGLFIAWAAYSLLYPINCPLTLLENYFRHLGGLPQLNGGFIDTYITGVLYPASFVGVIQVIAGATVLTSWIGLYIRHLRHRSDSHNMDRLKLG
ncbi:MAG TPA: DUF2784 domain-containing protein [Pseudonocardiaceae bacterium]|jgi:hypothetical protein|nr:DUF2784 domain-containing protein [Pseudonocardiaceae bacterium]